MPPIRIWTNFAPLGSEAPLLRRLAADNPIIVGEKSGSDPRLFDADIAFGQPDPKQVIELTNLKWIHVHTAGYTAYDRDDVRSALLARRAMLSNSSSVYCEPCAQHALAVILALARKLPHSMANQNGPRAWPAEELRAGSIVLNHQTALLVGFGAIGKRLAELLTPLHMKIIAVRKSVRGNEPIETHDINELDRLLPMADHVIDLLPASTSTMGTFNSSRFARMKTGAIFYNIGRGDTVDQSALVRALESGHLSAAWLDVMTPEPLPADHPLWTTPNCFISPHTAGGHEDEVERVVRHFVVNLRRFERKEPLIDRVI